MNRQLTKKKKAGKCDMMERIISTNVLLELYCHLFGYWIIALRLVYNDLSAPWKNSKLGFDLAGTVHV
jgi:hypothetical protein